jgi:hypothetical protein
MARILTVWVELPDKTDADALVASLSKTLGEGAQILVQEHVPSAPEGAASTEEDV